MYDFVDRPVTALDHGGRFLVWSMRNRVGAMHNRRCPPATIGPGFARLNLLSALPRFHRMMSILNLHARQDFAFAPTLCCRISEGEALLLDLLIRLPDRLPQDLAATLSLYVEASHTGEFHDALIGLYQAMQDGGIVPANPAGALPASSGNDSKRHQK